MNDWVDDLQDEIKKLKAQKKRLQAKNKKLREQVGKLERELLLEKLRPGEPQFPFPNPYPWWHPNNPYRIMCGGRQQ